MQTKLNAAGLDVRGAKNPNYKGGVIAKQCKQCGVAYEAKRAQASSKFCSLQCVGKSQTGKTHSSTKRRVDKTCEICSIVFSVPRSHSKRQHCCSTACSYKRRSIITAASKNPNWKGGLSGFPYPFNWGSISKRIRARDGNVCRNPNCDGKGGQIDTHHIDYDKMNVAPTNLIAVCTRCNTKANFGREQWTIYYTKVLKSIHPDLF